MDTPDEEKGSSKPKPKRRTTGRHSETPMPGKPRGCRAMGAQTTNAKEEGEDGEADGEEEDAEYNAVAAVTAEGDEADGADDTNSKAGPGTQGSNHAAVRDKGKQREAFKLGSQSLQTP
ncbi:hypothetical protein OG21DRAFT_1489220 [Imleria badia]|nr:hypothetical protein OG21DRAFT_1489220 [Imleria badia]